MPVVLLKQGGDVETPPLCGLHQIEQRPEFGTFQNRSWVSMDVSQ